MVDRKVVTTQQGQELAEEHGIQFFETSAKNDINVDAAFITITSDIMRKAAEEAAAKQKAAQKVVAGKFRLKMWLLISIAVLAISVLAALFEDTPAHPASD